MFWDCLKLNPWIMSNMLSNMNLLCISFDFNSQLKLRTSLSVLFSSSWGFLSLWDPFSCSLRIHLNVLIRLNSFWKSGMSYLLWIIVYSYWLLKILLIFIIWTLPDLVWGFQLRFWFLPLLIHILQKRIVLRLYSVLI